MDMRDPVVVAGPAREPVSVEDARAHLRIDQHEEDVWLLTAIRAAREDVESFTGRALITQTLELRLDGWPAGDELRLPRPPLQAVTAVEYFNRSGQMATLGGSVYLVDVGGGRLRLRWDQAWPGVTLQEMGGVVVRYRVGYGDEAAHVPARMRQAILMLVGHLYENREATVTAGAVMALPMGVERLLWPFRVF